VASAVYATALTCYLRYLVAPVDAIKAKAPNVIASLSDTFPRSQSATADEVALVFISSDSGEKYEKPDYTTGNRV
jgi:beta-glucosidase